MSTLPLAGAPEAIGGLNRRASWWRGRWEGLRAKASDRFVYALADQVVYSFGNMVVAALISRHCAQAAFGIYILTQRAMDVLIQISNVLLWAPFTFNLPGTTEERRAGYLGSTFSLQVVLCGAFTLLTWLVARWAGASARVEFDGTFSPLVWTAAGILFREFTRRMYFAQMRFKEAFWTDVATVGLQIGLTYGLWLRHRLDVRNTLWALCAGAVVVSLWWLFREWRTLEVRLVGLWGDLRGNLRLGRWFLGSNLVFLASSQCNPWVLGGMLGSAPVGAYAVCESVVNIPRVAFTSMQNVMGPMLARAEHESGRAGVRAAVKRLDRALFASSAALAVVIWGVGPFVARLIFKAPLVNARTVLLLLSLNLVAFAATLAQSYGLTALGRVDTTLYANLLGLVAQAAACVFLVRRFEVPGAAGALMLGSVVVLLARQWFFQRAVRAA
jgi:O-antigen/teichoic acid export membrane protein